MRFAVALPLTWSSSLVPWGISGAAGHPAACALQLLFPLGVVPGKGIAQPSPGSACACTDQPQRWSRNCNRRWVPRHPPPALGAGVCPLLFSGGSCHAARASRSAALRRCGNILCINLPFGPSSSRELPRSGITGHRAGTSFRLPMDAAKWLCRCCRPPASQGLGHFLCS